jgi:hypothetical protein
MYDNFEEQIVTTSVSDPDPDSIRSVDPDSNSECGSRREKMTRKIIKVKKFHVLKFSF